MDQASTLAQSVHATDGKSAYDNACKQLLSEKVFWRGSCKLVWRNIGTAM